MTGDKGWFEMNRDYELENVSLREQLATLRAENERLKQDVVEAVALRDKWINYAFVGEFVPPLPNGRAKELPTVIERLKQERDEARKEIADARTYILEADPEDDRKWNEAETLAEWIHHFGMDMESAEHEHMKQRADSAERQVAALEAENRKLRGEE